MSTPLKLSLKRKQPSDLRLKKLKELQSKRVRTVVHQSSVKPVKPTLVRQTCLSLEKVQEKIEVSLNRMKNVKVNRVMFMLPPLVTKWQKIGKEGNLGDFGNNDITKAKYSLSLTTFENPSKEQISFLNLLEATCQKILEDAASYTLGDNITLEDENDFKKDACISCIKTAEEQKVVNLTRRLVTFRGVPNDIVFWKKTKDSYKQVHPSHIPQGTVLQCIGSLRYYNVNGRYGISMDFARDIIVHDVPKESKKPTLGKVPAVPFLEW